MPTIFIENYSKYYFSNWFSLSTGICIVMTVVAIVLPFFAAFSTNGI